MAARLETVLSVDNIKVKAYHGWYKEERIIGGTYSVSVKMFSTCEANESFQSVEATVNYELIYNTVLEVMGREFHLIEHCCKTLFDNLKALEPANIWEVNLIKIHPPLKFVEQTCFNIKG